ncbi:PREDICTED: endochitinase A-like [Charadrius vociferus]|uniref:endochitinase A-like n=1 Tax=Charadrius vociferus TaxID=50402 RepID=UPI000521291A|nr:PREDICTED: endochitinase A-like [Charadrius vociferus]
MPAPTTTAAKTKPTMLTGAMPEPTTTTTTIKPTPTTPKPTTITTSAKPTTATTAKPKPTTPKPATTTTTAKPTSTTPKPATTTTTGNGVNNTRGEGERNPEALGMVVQRQHGFHNPDPNGICGEEAWGGAIRGSLACSLSLPLKGSCMAGARAGSGLARNDASPLSGTPGTVQAAAWFLPVTRGQVCPRPSKNIKDDAEPHRALSPVTGWLSPAAPHACKAPHKLHDFSLSFCPSTDQHHNCPAKQHADSLRDQRSVE